MVLYSLVLRVVFQDRCGYGRELGVGRDGEMEEDGVQRVEDAVVEWWW
jgi:hypothetical protein